MHHNDLILGIALVGVTLSFGCMSWFAYEQARLITCIRKYINPDRPITRGELRDAAYRLLPNELAIAKLFIGNVFWQIQATWTDWPPNPEELRSSARHARIAMSLSVLFIACTFLIPISVALLQHAA